MFTGIVESTGKVVAVEQGDERACLVVAASAIADGASIGDSVAVNGCCLTIAAMQGCEVGFDLLKETLRQTNLGALRAGALVNLERALAANGRLGGHFVQGHIDCTSPVRAFAKIGADHRMELELPLAFARYVAFKGSIAINGISLTVAELGDESFVVWIIPHTLAVTNLQMLQTGDAVNLEFDLLAKYLERLIQR